MMTVVFATRNRAAALAGVLRAFANQLPPSGGWKLIVVDNGSTDDTLKVLADARSSLPLTILREERPGKSRALNRAVAAFVGDLVVVTDDDVIPDLDWLQQWRAVADANPNVAIFGGGVVPTWPSLPSPCLAGRHIKLATLYALILQPSGPCSHTSIFGPNMAIRQSIFGAGIRFDERIGPDSSNENYPMGTEWEFTQRLESLGYLSHFAAEVRVKHIIRAEQLERGWVLARAYRNGLGTAVSIRRRPGRAGRPPLAAAFVAAAQRVRWRVLAALVHRLPQTPSRLSILFKDRWFGGFLAGSTRASSVRSVR